MKKILYTIPLIILLVGFIFSGCGKPESALTPGTEYYGTEAAYIIGIPNSIPGNYGMITDLDPSTATEIEGEIFINFTGMNGGDINPATVNSTNITIESVTSGASVNDLTITYDAGLKRIIIAGTFSNDAAYRIVLSANLRTIGNGQIDGNGNGKADGIPYDNYDLYVYTGTGSSDFYTPGPLSITWYWPTGGNQSIMPWIELDFEWYTTNMLDTSKVNLANFSLVKEETGTTVTCDLIMKMGSFIGIQPASNLDYATIYKVTFKTTEFSDTMDNLPVLWGDYNYGDDIPDISYRFMTVGDPGNDIYATPFEVNSVSQSGNEVKIVFSDTINTETFTNERLRMVDPNELVLPYEIRYDNDKETIYLSLANATVSGTYEFYFSRDLESTHEWKLDGNGNGIGGENTDPHLGIDADDYYTTKHISP
jgi:hypothetical protein